MGCHFVAGVVSYMPYRFNVLSMFDVLCVSVERGLRLGVRPCGSKTYGSETCGRDIS